MSPRIEEVRVSKLATLAGVLVALMSLSYVLLGIRQLRGTPPTIVPRSAGELELRWDAVLEGAVCDGVVDYGMLDRRRQQVAELVGTLAVFGPKTAPDAFQARDARLAYYINAYNALVVFAVLERGVRRSVRDVHGWLEPVQGMGFFWAQRFVVDGESTSLHALENQVLRVRFADARIHAAINCASSSCPALASHAYHGSDLRTELRDASRRLTAPPHVVIDDARREIVLSAIYEWYAADFDEHAESLGRDRSALDWIARHAADATPIERARREGYTVRHAPYDWTLNGHW